MAVVVLVVVGSNWSVEVVLVIVNLGLDLVVVVVVVVVGSDTVGMKAKKAAKNIKKIMTLAMIRRIATKQDFF